MRELKFRGWHREAKDMAFFCLGEDGISCLSEENEQYTFHLADGHPVMQFTGLLDRNGEEIYEGDIVLTERGTARQITWDQGTMQPFGSYFDQFDEWEVIGNIHQNQELLKCTEY